MQPIPVSGRAPWPVGVRPEALWRVRPASMLAGRADRGVTSAVWALSAQVAAPSPPAAAGRADYLWCGLCA